MKTLREGVQAVVDGSPDAELVAELRRGSQAALAELFERYGDRIHTYCFRRTASWELAEDATSTVFLEAWRTRDRLRLSDQGEVIPWLYGIATIVCRNQMRSMFRQLRLVEKVTSAHDTAREPDPADDVAARLDDEGRMRDLIAAIDRLPPRERDVVALVAWSGLTYHQAATALGVPVGTVRSRLSRARARLQSGALS